jgi:hypothetical protein
VAVVVAGGLLAGLLLTRGGHSNPAVAHVGGEEITRDQLDATVDHFRKAAESEGMPFPDEKSARFRTVRNRLLGLLVYRTELAQAARRLGLHVTNIQVLRRMSPGGEGEEGGSTDRFQYDTVKTQLLYERIYAKVTRGINAPTIPERIARKNAAMKRYLDKLERETVLVEVVERLTLGALRVDDGRSAELQLAGHSPGGRRTELAAGVRAGDADRRPVGHRRRAGVVVGRRDDAALERADLQVVGARREVGARVVHRLRACQRVPVTSNAPLGP